MSDENNNRVDDFEKDSLLAIMAETEKLANVGGWEWDIAKNLWTFSDNWLHIHGCSGRHLTTADLIPIAHPDDRTDIQMAFDKAVTEGGNYEIEHRIIRQDTGEVRYIRSFGKPRLDSDGKAVKLFGAAQDITAQKRSENALQKSKKKYRDLVNTLPYGIEEIDLYGRRVFLNDSYHRILGYKPGELVGTYIWDNDPTEKSAKKVKEYFDYIKKEMPTPEPYISKNLKNDGTVIDLIIDWDYKFDEKGELTGFIAVVTNITQSKRIEKEKLRLERQLQQTQKMEAIGTLAGGIAHDFNNILSSVIGFAELAIDDVEKGSNAEDSLREVFAAGKRAKDLVKQILAFARQSGEEIKPIQPGVIAKEVISFIRSSIPTTIEIKQKIDSNSLIMGNATQIHQILMNLCTNAAHAMEDKGGILEVRIKDITVDEFSNIETTNRKKLDLNPGDYIEIKVSDTGVGISPEIIDSIFEPYFTTKGPGEGTGMGLAMVHGIIESSAGKITVDSTLGKGTVFSIYLPITKKRGTYQQYVEEDFPSGTERILFVDDELPIAKMGGQILERLGYQVTVRTSSVETLELFRAKPDDFDLLITDMTMPKMTGDKLALELMQIRPDIPVILCTGYSKKISDEIATKIGIKGFAYKPVVKSDLAKTVRKVLDEAKIKNCK